MKWDSCCSGRKVLVVMGFLSWKMAKIRDRYLHFVLLPILIAIVFSALSPNVLAQATDSRIARRSGQLEEVIVTARRKSESIQDVPMAVSNFNSEALADFGISDIGEIGRITPSLVFARSPGQGVNPIVALRGQVQNDPSVLTLDPSVGIYMDDVYLGRSPGSLLDMVDIDRVEVLKGPQGTLYGRNTTGGAIKVIPKKAKPGGDWEGYVRYMKGNFNSVHAEGGINLPFTNTAAARVVYSKREHDGYTTALLFSPDDPEQQIGERDTSNKNTDNYRINVIWDAMNTLIFDLGYDNTKTDTNGGSIYEQFSDRARTNSLGGIDHYERSSDDFYTYATDIPSVADVDTDGWYIKGIYQFPWFETKMIYAERTMDYHFRIDPDGTNARGVEQDAFQKTGQKSFEMQISGSLWHDRLSYVVGYFDFEEDGRDRSFTFASEVVAAALGVPSPPLPPGSVALLSQNGDAEILNINESWFAQVSVDIIRNLSLTLGGRTIQETKGLDMVAFDSGLANDVLGPDSQPGTTENCIYDPEAEGVQNDGTNCRFNRKTDYDYDVWMASLDWHITDKVLLYVKRARGSRSGGQNFRGRTSETLVPFDPEFVIDTEAGMKGDFFNRRLRLNIAAYRSDYTDIQFSDVVEISTFVDNLGDATIDGTEIELTYLITDTLDVVGSGTLMNFEYDDPTLVGPYAPDKKASLNINYKRPFGWGEFGATVGYSYSDKVSLDNQLEPFKKNPAVSQPAYGLYNASAYVFINSLDLRIGAFGNNLDDEEYKVNVVPSFLDDDPNTGGVITTGSPRTYGIEVVKNFSL